MRNLMARWLWTVAVLVAGASSAVAGPKIVILIGEDEYQTNVTLPEFAKTELEPRGYTCQLVLADPQDPHNFAGLETALPSADALLVSVRRRAPTAGQMAAIRAHVAAGKSVIGIRTASHAFDARGKHPAGHVEWTTFDPDVLGGNYHNHHPNDKHPVITLAPSSDRHPILVGVAAGFTSSGSLYKSSPLKSTARPLLQGTIDGAPTEPVAWTNMCGESRVFYTSLGHVDDFKLPAFRRLLVNGIDWTLAR